MNNELELELSGAQAEDVSPTVNQATRDQTSDSWFLENEAKQITDEAPTSSLMPLQSSSVPKLDIFLDQKLLKCVEFRPDQTLTDLRKILSVAADTNFLSKGAVYCLQDEPDTNVEEIWNEDVKAVFLATKAALDSSPTTVEDQSPAVEDPQQSALPLPSKQVHDKAVFLRTEGRISLFQMPAENLSQTSAERKRTLQSFGECKTLLMVGETGAGKSTLINALINFWLGVTLEDNLRYIIDEQAHPRLQTSSQTSEVKFYYLKGTDGRPNLLLIDTPGYGDTQGVKRDLQIDAMISNLLLNDISSIDMACFVAKASTVRFTDTQKYVYQKILNFFDDSSLANFKYVFTFADGADPQVIKELTKPGSIIEPMIKSYQGRSWFIKVNNSSLLACDSPDNVFVRMYWQLTNSSLETLCQSLNSTKRYSLKTFQQNWRQMEKLRSQRETKESVVNKELLKLYNLHKIYRALGLHRGAFELKKPHEDLVQVQNNVLDFDEPYRNRREDEHQNFAEENGIQQKLIGGNNRYQAVPREPAFSIDEDSFEWKAIRISHLETRYAKPDAWKVYREYQIQKGLVAEHNEISNRCLMLLEEICTIDEDIFKLQPRKNNPQPKMLLALLEDHIAHFAKNRGRLTEVATQALQSLKVRLQKLRINKEMGTNRLAQLKQACERRLLDEPEPKPNFPQQFYEFRYPILIAVSALVVTGIFLGPKIVAFLGFKFL